MSQVSCIFADRVSVTGDPIHSGDRRHARATIFSLVGVFCLLLSSLLTVIQVTHTHPIGADTSTCPLCVVLHSAAPVTPTAAVVVIVSFGQAIPVPRPRALVRFWRPKFFTRPPPMAA